MRILFFITKAERGGTQTHVADLIDRLSDECELGLAIGEEGFLTDHARTRGVQVQVMKHLVHEMDPITDLKAIAEATQAIRRFKPDIVHAHNSKAGIIGRAAAALTRHPAVFTAHTWAFAEGTRWSWRVTGKRLERLASYASTEIITVSEANRRLALREGITKPTKLTTIHNGIPDSALRATPGGADKPVRAVMVARFSEQKDQMLLLEAARLVDQRLVIDFIGNGTTREAVERQATEWGMSGRVHFFGERSDIAEILAQAQVFVLASKWEGLPITILEAMRAGLPVIASDVGGVRESVRHGLTGLLVPPRDVNAMAGALDQLCSDRGLRQRMGTAARDSYVANFTVEQMVRQTMSVYHRAIKGRKDPSASRSAVLLRGADQTEKACLE